MAELSDGKENRTNTLEKLRQTFRRFTKSNTIEPQAPKPKAVDSQTAWKEGMKPNHEINQTVAKANPDPLKPAMNLVTPEMELMNKMSSAILREFNKTQEKIAEIAPENKEKVSINSAQTNVVAERRETRAQSIDNDGYSDMPISFHSDKPKQEFKETKGQDDVIYVNMREQAKLDADASIAQAKQRLEAFKVEKAKQGEIKKQANQDIQASKTTQWQVARGKYEPSSKNDVVESQSKSSRLEKLKRAIIQETKIFPETKDYLVQTRKDEYRKNFGAKPKVRTNTDPSPKKIVDSIRARSKTSNEHTSGSHPAETPTEANKRGKGKTGLNI